ncbi:hypothetical protein MNBD_GAMMA12-3928 [hydrothermal vent metagenome]|uniref:Uncharacterized protein n=1 Tax=hydrothermal vent metagenome TaxID=652676 RepID=A0A3B0ZDM0_9ZZZZ
MHNDLPLDPSFLKIINQLMDGNIESVAQAEVDLQTLRGSLATSHLHETLSDAQQQVVASLQTGNNIHSYDDWRQQQVSHFEKSLLKVDDYLAQLETEWGPILLSPFNQRLKSLQLERDSDKANLLLDSLLIDLSKLMTQRTEYSEQLEKLSELALIIKPLDAQCAAQLQSQIVPLSVRDNITLLRKIYDEYNLKRNALELHSLNQSRRSVIIEGLKNLGYAINEGMETSLAENGKLLLKKSATEDYGVELVGLKDNAQLQVRAVAFDNNDQLRNSDQDIAAEQSWCDEFHVLIENVKQQEGEIDIQKSWPVGKIPLRVIHKVEETQQSYQAKNNKLQSRKLK